MQKFLGRPFFGLLGVCVGIAMVFLGARAFASRGLSRGHRIALTTGGGSAPVWAGFQNNSSLAGLGTGFGSPGTTKWIDGYVFVTTPIISGDGTVWLSSLGSVIGVDPATGAQKYLITIPSSISHVGVLGMALGQNDVLYVKCVDQYTYAFDLSTLANLWSFGPDGTGEQQEGGAIPIVGPDETIYLASMETLYALDPSTGQPKWTIALPDPATLCPCNWRRWNYFLSGLTRHLCLRRRDWCSEVDGPPKP